MNPIDNAIVLEEAKKYSDRKGGYTKPGKTLLDVALTDGKKVVEYKIGLEVGKTYTVTTDSGTYTAVCKMFMDVAPCLGNLSVLAEDLENTGETFVVTEYMEDANVVVTAVDQNGGSFIKVTTPKNIVPIDPKFLPGVCLPVLELSQETMAGVFASGNASCTAEEHAIIWGAYQALSPLIIKGNYNGIAFSGVSNILLDEYSNPYFMADAGKMKVQVAFDDKTANIRSVQQ